MPPKSSEKGAAGSTTDARFSTFQTDPRYRLPSKKKTKIALDSRFAHALTNPEFANAAKVDRYGRKVKGDKKNKALSRLYERAPELKPDEEDEEDEEKDEQEEGKEDDVEADDDELVQRELRRAHTKIDPARGGGFSESESDDSSSEEDSDAEDEGEDESAVATVDVEQFKEQQEDIEPGEVTSRIAIVNLDWDHLRSVDLMALLGSFAPDNGRVERVSVFPSEFGKERMQNEEINGPPKELFESEKKQKSTYDSDSGSDSDSDSDSEKKIKKGLLKASDGNDEEMNSDALRRYQLDRLRYYYAVMECSSPAVAKKLYDAVDGTEYQSSSNLLDLRFVPDDVTFDDPPRDTCTKVPESYKPIEFVTSALQSSKVKLTWDMHPEEVSRKDLQKKVFSGSRADIEENDMNAYLASDTSDSEPEEQDGDAPKLSKKEKARRDMRAALGLADEPAPRARKEDAGDMEVTFLPAFSGKSKKPEPEAETTIEKYKRKEKERKEQKRAMAKAKRGEIEEDAEDAEVGQAEDRGFDDPFFTQAEEPKLTKSAQRKEERLQKRVAREAAEAESAGQKAHLTKVMESVTGNQDQAEHIDHFDMNDIARAEKIKGKKGKTAKRLKEQAEKKGGGNLQDGFEVDVDDDRFKAIFDSHEYAIDPSNPRYTGTSGMKKMLDGRRKKRSGGDIEEKKSKRGRK